MDVQSNDTQRLQMLIRWVQQAVNDTAEPVGALTGGGSRTLFLRVALGKGSAIPNAMTTATANTPAGITTNISTNVPTSVIAAANPNLGQVAAFHALTTFFNQHALPVPQLFAIAPEHGFYLMEDLGDQTLASLLAQATAPVTGNPAHSKPAHPSSNSQSLAWQALEESMRCLPRFQCEGVRALAQLQPPPAKMDATFFADDWQVFMHYFVGGYLGQRGIKVPYTMEMQQECVQWFEALGHLSSNFFCHRDFQARNLMVKKSPDTSTQPLVYVIDYQDACYGPLGYDVISLLYSADSGLTETQRQPLLQIYLDALALQSVKISAEAFYQQHLLLLWIRRLQALGAYARIAEQSKKPEYLNKIVPTLKVLLPMLEAGHTPPMWQALTKWLQTNFAAVLNAQA